MYNNKNFMLDKLNSINDINLPSYFQPWLSGFIEAEGNFSLIIRESGSIKKSSFSIGQLDELHILKKIKLYFQSDNKIIKDKKKRDLRGSVMEKGDYYRFFLYNAFSRKLLFEHFAKYPLMGFKKLSYNKFYDFHIQRINSI